MVDHQQCWKDHVEGIRVPMHILRIEEGRNNCHQHTPLTYAVAFGQEGIVKHLLTRGCACTFACPYPVYCRYGNDNCDKVSHPCMLLVFVAVRIASRCE